jgi:hypothetical protein
MTGQRSIPKPMTSHAQQTLCQGLLADGHEPALGGRPKWRVFRNRRSEAPAFFFVSQAGHLLAGPKWSEARRSTRQVRAYFWTLGEAQASAQRAPLPQQSISLEDLGL